MQTENKSETSEPPSGLIVVDFGDSDVILVRCEPKAFDREKARQIYAIARKLATKRRAPRGPGFWEALQAKREAEREVNRLLPVNNFTLEYVARGDPRVAEHYRRPPADEQESAVAELRSSGAGVAPSASRYLQWWVFLIPRRHREWLTEDLWEDVGELRGLGWTEQEIIRHLRWQLAWIIVERLSAWVSPKDGIWAWVVAHLFSRP